MQKLDLTFAFRGPPDDLPASGVEGGQQIERATALVFLFYPHRTLRSRGQGRRLARTRLQAGPLVQTPHLFPRQERAGVEITSPLHGGAKRGIAGYLGREPHAIAPGFEPMRAEYLSDALPTEGGSYLLDDELRGDFLAIPHPEAATANIGTLTGALDCVPCHLRGKKRACAPAPLGRISRECVR